MANVSKVGEDTYLIKSRQAVSLSASSLPLSSVVYVTGDKDKVLIESGSGAAVGDMLQGITDLGLDPSSIRFIIPTHVHLDHGGGVGELVKRLPNLRVATIDRNARHLLDPTRLIAGTRQAFGDRFEEEYGPILAVSRDRIEVVEEGDFLRLSDRELRILYAPGHTSHHSIVFDSKTKGLFCGEALGLYESGMGCVRPAHPGGFDLDLALQSIDTIRGLAPSVLYFSHRDTSTESPRLIELAKEMTETYGRLILDGLRAGDGLARIAETVQAYQVGRYAPGFKPTPGLGAGIDGYVGHFRRKGLAPA